MPGHSLFRHTHRVTYSDCTLGDHVYYGRYLDILEEARGEFFRHLGTTCRALQEQGISLPVIECRLRYRSPARYDDLLVVELGVAEARGVRLNFGYRVTTEHGKLLLEAESFHVCADEKGRPKRPPAELLSLLIPPTQKGSTA